MYVKILYVKQSAEGEVTVVNLFDLFVFKNLSSFLSVTVEIVEEKQWLLVGHGNS